jgi:outer membrane protein OmpA-like peptidoglycan-associated protein
MRLRPDIWLLGLPLVAAVAAAGIWRVAPAIETDLRRAIEAQQARTAGSELGRSGARVEVDGRDLSVTADAPLTGAARSEAERLVASIAGLRGPAYRVLPPASAERFAFGVTRDGAGLVLTGLVPPGGLRAELLDEAAGSGAPVRDELRSALGGPEGFGEAARVVVRAARRLDRATASLSDKSLSVSGDAPDTQAYREVMGLLRALPPGYAAGRVEIRPPLVQPYTWSAAREGDAIVLGGHVPSDAERGVLLAFARSANPAARIEDRMDIARGLESGVDFDAASKRVLSVLARLESGRAELKGRALVLEGTLAARDLLDQLRGELRTARLPGVELERAELTPVLPKPYRLSARRKDGRVLLAGFLPAEADRAALRDAVRKRFPFDAVVDDLHLADGAPEGLLPAARAGLEHLAALSDGEVVIEDRRLRLSGASLYPEQGRRTERAFEAAAPPGWTAAAQVFVTPNRPLDPGFCSDLVSDVVGREPLRFAPGAAELTPAARKLLDGIADVMRRCGTARLNVAGLVEPAGDDPAARELAGRRAAAVVSALGERGVSAVPEAVRVAEAGRAGEAVTFEVQQP